MQTWPQASKYKMETISIIMDFSDDFSPGESISGTPAIAISIYAGLDPTPLDMLYEPVEVTKGYLVNQRFKQGVEGNIYIITYTIQTSLGKTYEKEAYLAILEDLIPADSQYIPFYYTTGPYPLNVTGDGILGVPNIVSGRTLNKLITTPDEYIQGTPNIQSGTLISVRITYNETVEYIQGSPSIQSGTYTLQRFTYTTTADSMQANPAIMSGTFALIRHTYTSQPENIQGIPSIQSGTYTI